MPDITKLDKVFSEYIRRRDADEYGRVKCCTCDNTFHWSEMDAGHFRYRSIMSIRFDERNCHAQCRECNRFKDGMWDEHADYVIKRHGLDAGHELYLLAHKTVKFMQFEIDEMVQIYKQKIRDL